MKNNVKIFVPVFLAIIIGSLTFIFAQSSDDGGKTRFGKDKNFGGGSPQGGFHPSGIPPHVIDQLNLTDVQKQQIKTLEDSARTASKDYFDKLKAFDEQLKTIVDAGTFNEEQARQILTGKSQAMTEVEIIRLKTDAAIKNLLTAEQKTQLEQLKQQRPEFGRGRGPGMPPPPQN